ncbi:MAG: AI-2E family transporter [Candidatus Marinimicrobia bacterium]|nr:AI-2E family transporter [Candidatus Neomarinimicrobiota bacterium]
MTGRSAAQQSVFRYITRLMVTIGIIIALFYFLPRVEDILILFLISLLLYSLLVPLVNNLESKGIPRAFSIIIVFLIGFVVVGIALNFIIPPITKEAKSLQETITQQGPEKVFQNISNFIKSRFPMLDTRMITEKMGGYLSSTLSKGVGVVLGFVSVFTSLLIVLFMTFFLLKDQRTIKKTLIGIVPNRFFEMSLVMVYRIENQLGSYIRGVLLDGLIVAILSSIGLYMLGIPFFYFVGIIAGLTNMIPYMGPLIGATVAIIVALMSNPESLMIIVKIAALFAIVQLIDNVLITPVVVSNAVDLHPLVVMLVVLVGGSLLGLTGLIFAIPLTSIIKVIGEELVKGLKSYRFV